MTVSKLVRMLVDHVTEQGMLDAALLYDPPFTDLAPTGPILCSVNQDHATVGRTINRSAVA